MRYLPLYLLFILPLLTACDDGGTIGVFDSVTAVGHADGELRYDADADEYRLTGRGQNASADQDAFQYAWRRVEGDVAVTADVSWPEEGGHEESKAGWMVRSSLTEDAPYAGAVVHGDGLIALQYRIEEGGEMHEVRSPYRAPATIRLERDGDLFSLSVSPASDTTFHPVGAVTAELDDPVYAGLAVASNDSAAAETAVFTNVEFDVRGVVEDDQRVVESTLEIIDVETGKRRVVRRARELFEAPNWTPDGQHLIYNKEGRLYRIPVEGGEPEMIDTGFADNCNNDHGISPDGSQLVISHSPEGEGSTIYVLPAEGGTPRKVTEAYPSYWHGWSPDGRTLAYVGRRDGEFDIYTIPVEGGQETRLTEAEGLDDGPDYSPDGQYIFFNSVRSGQMHIYRMNADGSDERQWTDDAPYGDWFPHPSPDGEHLVFISYDADVEGHPRHKNVKLRMMPMEGGEPEVLATLFGGQGTINVPSWSPDSREFAFVSYRLVAPDVAVQEAGSEA